MFLQPHGRGAGPVCSHTMTNGFCPEPSLAQKPPPLTEVRSDTKHTSRNERGSCSQNHHHTSSCANTTRRPMVGEGWKSCSPLQFLSSLSTDGGRQIIRPDPFIARLVLLAVDLIQSTQGGGPFSPHSGRWARLTPLRAVGLSSQSGWLPKPCIFWWICGESVSSHSGQYACFTPLRAWICFTPLRAWICFTPLSALDLFHPTQGVDLFHPTQGGGSVSPHSGRWICFPPTQGGGSVFYPLRAVDLFSTHSGRWICFLPTEGGGSVFTPLRAVDLFHSTQGDGPVSLHS
ncbi:hypothetical protein BaRGS_00002784 [Batillaria attramentaria]|uniref:Uncharacterized protein n=1 Tax=Batillaria attramentaria TaxID=370345 RepID=A0ABD0M369_9CAEN